jgi:septal ring factor EnvC (AmiA/AmiB activator)
MSIEKTMLRANRLIAVLPQYVRPDMEQIVTLVNEQQKQIEAQAETILQQRISLKQAHSNNAELFKALWVLGYMPETIVNGPQKDG